MDAFQIAARIDHTLLKPEATLADIDRLIDEAIRFRFASVCVNPIFVPHVHNRLRESRSGVKTCSVVGFPLGANFASIKAGEAASVIARGAEEIDVVAHLPHLLACDRESARGEIMEVVYAARELRWDIVVKVIVETAALMRGATAVEAERRIATACYAVEEAGADFIKTSTGFHPTGGATVEAVKLLRKHAGRLKVKAAGGVRSLADAVAMFDAGAERLGCSCGVEIVSGSQASGGY
jgi:deoxyribose-phosphate aldolase